MTFPKAICVKLGSGKTGLSGGTLGYTIKSMDGVNTYQARTVLNIAELGSSGDYFATLAYDEAWPYVVRIEWDDSASSPTFRVGEELEMPHYFFIWPRRTFSGKGGQTDAASALVNDGLTWGHRRSTIAGATLGTLGGGISVSSIPYTPIDHIVGPGTFDEVNKINLRSSATGNVRINLIGSGLGSTIIQSTVRLADPGAAYTNVSRGCAIVPGNGSEVSDFTISDYTDDGDYWAGIGMNVSFDFQSAAYRFERIWIKGDSDGIFDNYFGGAGDSPASIGQIVVGKDSHIHCNYHMSRTFWSWQHHIYSNVNFNGAGPSAVLDGENQTACIVPTNARIDLYDCDVRARDGTDETFGVNIVGTGQVNLIRTRAHGQSASGDVADIKNNSGGTVNVLASHYDPTKVTGSATVHPLRGVDAVQFESTDASTLIDARITAANLATAAALQAVDELIDTVKSKTDNLPAAFPSNFASMTISVGGNVSIAQAFPTNFSLLTINGSGQVVSSNAGSVDLDPVLAAIAALPGTAVGTALNFICPINAKLSFVVSNSKSQSFSATDFDSTGWTQFVFTIKADANDSDDEALIIVRVTNPVAGSDGLLRLNGASATANLASLEVVVEDGDTLVTLELTAAAMAIQPSPDGKPYRWELTRWTNGVKVPMGRGEFVALPSLSGSITPP